MMDPSMNTCQYVVGYEPEVPGSDVADPRLRCGEPATVRLEDGTWLCSTHAERARLERARSGQNG
jgi:hypothetical protein